MAIKGGKGLSGNQTNKKKNPMLLESQSRINKHSIRNYSVAYLNCIAKSLWTPNHRNHTGCAC